MPFVLMVGTKKAGTRQEEYRWILPGIPEPPRSAVFCRLKSGKMNRAFLRLRFGHARAHPDLNAAFADLKASGLVRVPYVVQIEHFPDQHFPSA